MTDHTTHQPDRTPPPVPDRLAQAVARINNAATEQPGPLRVQATKVLNFDPIDRSAIGVALDVLKYRAIEYWPAEPTDEQDLVRTMSMLLTVGGRLESLGLALIAEGRAAAAELNTLGALSDGGDQ